MELGDILTLLSGKLITKGVKINRSIQCAIACDLLSWVVGNARPNCAFITIQTSMNTIAVASLIEMGCIIIVEDAAIDDKVIKKSIEEDIPILKTPLTTFEVCGLLYKYGVKAIRKNETVC